MPEFRFKVLPTSENEKHMFLRRVFYYLISACLVWIIAIPADIGDKGTVVQAAVAVVLVWATFQSIDRADRQVEVAQSTLQFTQQQIELLKEQIEDSRNAMKGEYTTSLVWSLDDLDGSKVIKVINLSRYPIYIESFETYNFEERSDGMTTATDHLSKGKILESSGVISITIIGVRQMQIVGSLPSSLLFSGYEPPNDIIPNAIEIFGFTLSYRYAGSPDVVIRETRTIHTLLEEDWRGRMLDLSFLTTKSSDEGVENYYQELKALWKPHEERLPYYTGEYLP